MVYMLQNGIVSSREAAFIVTIIYNTFSTASSRFKESGTF